MAASGPGISIKNDSFLISFNLQLKIVHIANVFFEDKLPQAATVKWMLYSAAPAISAI